MAKKLKINFASTVVTIEGAKTITEVREPLWFLKELVGSEPARVTIKGPKFIFESKEKLSLAKPLTVIKMGLKWFLVSIKGKEVYVQPQGEFELKAHLPKAA